MTTPRKGRHFASCGELVHDLIELHSQPRGFSPRFGQLTSGERVTRFFGVEQAKRLVGFCQRHLGHHGGRFGADGADEPQTTSGALSDVFGFHPR